MLLGTRNITHGDTRRLVVDYSEFLDKGVKLATGTASTTAATSSVHNVSLNDTLTGLIIFVTGGDLNETFTVSVQITDSQGETVNDTIAFTVVAP